MWLFFARSWYSCELVPIAIFNVKRYETSGVITPAIQNQHPFCKLSHWFESTVTYHFGSVWERELGRVEAHAHPVVAVVRRRDRHRALFTWKYNMKQHRTAYNEQNRTQHRPALPLVINRPCRS